MGHIMSVEAEINKRVLKFTPLCDVLILSPSVVNQYTNKLFCDTITKQHENVGGITVITSMKCHSLMLTIT